MTDPLTLDHATALAVDLIRELSADIGDLDSVNVTLRRWHDVLETDRLGLVCMAAVQAVFADCLSRVTHPDFPPESIGFDERQAA